VSQGGTSSAGSSGSDSGGSGGQTPALPGCKRGLAWANSSLDNEALKPAVTWWYNWGPRANSVLDGIEFVPMIWGAGFEVDTLVENIPGGAQHVLGFNEPNFFEQADLSASASAAAWPGVEAVAAQRGLVTVSPAVNFCGDDQNKTGPCHDTNPVDYLTDFFAACQGCDVDHIAVHWYNCTGDDLVFYLDQFKHFGKPIWLTEFACGFGGDTSEAGQEAYMREAIPLLEADPQVTRYSWFSGDPLPSARLIDGSGQLTPLGEVYVSLEYEPCE
jgi:hypothetical protein